MSSPCDPLGGPSAVLKGETARSTGDDARLYGKLRAAVRPRGASWASPTISRAHRSRAWPA